VYVDVRVRADVRAYVRVRVRVRECQCVCAWAYVCVCMPFSKTTHPNIDLEFLKDVGSDFVQFVLFITTEVHMFEFW